jgi:hypothetical protein
MNLGACEHEDNVVRALATLDHVRHVFVIGMPVDNRGASLLAPTYRGSKRSTFRTRSESPAAKCKAQIAILQNPIYHW